jgi:hypothetical protein
MVWAPRFPARPAQVASTVKMAPRTAAICSVVAKGKKRDYIGEFVLIDIPERK